MKRNLLIGLITLCLSFFAEAPMANAFFDLPETHRYSFPFTYLQSEGVIKGYPDGTVKPDQEINRAELVKILVEGLQFKTDPNIHQNCFPDVTSEWFAPYVCFAKSQNWIGGYKDGTFKPTRTVNKVEALKIIINAFNISTESARAEFMFKDTPIESWYAPFLSVAREKNVLEEATSSFYPEKSRTRGEVAEMVARIKMINVASDPQYNDWIKAEFQNYLLLEKLREENGVVGKLKLNPILIKVARAHSRDMAENLGNLNHIGSDNRTSYQRMEDEGIPRQVRTGENIGRAGFSGKNFFAAIEHVHRTIFMPEADEGCNHRTTLLSKCLPFTEVGMGVYVKDGYVYFTNDFITDSD